MTTIVAPPWEEQPIAGRIPEAPSNGKTYGRKDAAWAEVVAPEQAAEIVTAAALPLPDVWAPLSDSLRMITGYGREVKVGEDVVSQMVNFSRSTTATYIGKDGLLKTAAVNEPRFEKEGLLIEGQSTNLMAAQTWTHYASAMNGRVSNVIVNGENEAEIRYETGDVGFSSTAVNTVSLSISAVIGDISKYISFEVKLSRALTGSETIKFHETGSSGTSACHIITASNCAQFVGVFARKSVMDVSPMVYTASGANGVFAYVSDALTAPLTVSMRRVQAEALPFATSYIPTNGAAATRAADVCWIQNALNVGPDAPVGDTAINFALAFESDFKRTTGITAPSICGIAPSANLLASQRRASLEDDGTLSLWCGTKTTYGIAGRGVAVICKRGAESICSYNGSIQKAPFINGYAGSYLALETGHVRNIRIWLNAITDEQIKALK